MEGSSIESIPATKLQGQGSESSGCVQQSSCGSVNWNAGANSNAPSMSIDDAISPVNQWIKDFQKKAGDASDLLSAAKATVAPLINKLKRTQQIAVERLEESNEQILQRVEESATEHIYNLLKAQKITDDKAEQSEARKLRREELKEEASAQDALRKLFFPSLLPPHLKVLQKELPRSQNLFLPALRAKASLKK